MKKLYILLISLSFLPVFAQTFTILTPPGGAPGLVTAPGIDVTGDTVIYCDDFSDSTIIIQGKLYVVNETGASINTAVQRYEECLINGTENYFCWDICWSSAVSLSGPMTITAGDTVDYFYGDYKPKGNAGAGVIRYRFFDENNTANFSEVYIKFNAGGCASIEECYIGIEEEHASITSAYPNPATDNITFEFDTKGETGIITISDLTGKMVRQTNVNSNTTTSTINVQDLNPGIYFYSFYVNNKNVSTRKFIIK